MVAVETGAVYCSAVTLDLCLETLYIVSSHPNGSFIQRKFYHSVSAYLAALLKQKHFN